GELQPVVLDLLPQLPPLLPVVGVRAGVRVEPAQLDPLVAQVRQLVQDQVEVVGRLLLVEQVRPAADGELLHTSSSVRSSEFGLEYMPVIAPRPEGGVRGRSDAS